MSATDYLRQKTKDLQAQYEEVKGSMTLIGVIVTVLVMTMLGMAVMASPPLRGMGFGQTGLGTGLGVVVLIFLVVLGILLPILFISKWMDSYWRRSYREAWSWLKYTDLSQFVVDDGRWELIFNELDVHPSLKFTRTQRPQNLDEQIELASDYRLALMALTREVGEPDIAKLQRRLGRTIWWGSLTRLADNLMSWVLNGCMVWGCLAFGGMFWYTIGLPLWLPLVCLYLRRQAWQTAMVDYFLGKPSVRVRGVKSPLKHSRS